MNKINPKPNQFKPKTKLETSYIRPPKFLERITTLHGIKYFNLKSGRSLLAWTMLIIAHITLTITFLVIIKQRYNSDQIVTQIYSDWSVDKVPFPAVSICNLNLVSLNESKTIEKILRENNVSHEEIESFFHDLYYLLDFDIGSHGARSHLRIMDILKIHFYTVYNIMQETHQTCKNLLVYCDYNGKPKVCENVFNMIETYAGFCCTFNFNGLDDDGGDPMMSQDDDFEYYNDRGDDSEDSKTSIIATSQSGSSSGLRVVFNVEPDDYADWSMVQAYGAKILLSDPNDFVEMRVIYRYVSIGESMHLKVEPMIYECEDNLRFVDVKKRGCWFHNEVDLVHTNRYSYETCSTECKIKSYNNYCGCVPYKYPIVDWESTKTPCVPTCYKECRDKFYSVVTDTLPFLPASYPTAVTSGRNVSELAAFHVYYIKPTCNCYKMSLLTDTNTFIATYGGIFSLCFGASIITICELAYLCLASFTEIMWKKIFSK